MAYVILKKDTDSNFSEDAFSAYLPDFIPGQSAKLIKAFRTNDTGWFVILDGNNFALTPGRNVKSVHDEETLCICDKCGSIYDICYLNCCD